MNRIRITDLTMPELDIYARVSEGQLLHYYEPDLGIFIAESPKVIGRALEADYEPISFLIEEGELRGEALQIIEQCRDVPVYTASYEVLKNLTGFELTRGMLCAMRRKALPDLKETLQNARRIAVLEEVVNPTNVGAIFRSAAALNMDAVIFTKGCCDPLYRRSVRVSMGTVFQLPWTVLDSSKTLNENLSYQDILRQNGFKTVAFALRNDSISIDDPILSEEPKLAIILGTEGEGLKSSTIADSDYTVKIPMSHGVDSLNVAAASAIAFWELGKF